MNLKNFLMLLILICTLLLVVFSACGVKGPPMPLYKDEVEVPIASPSPSPTPFPSPRVSPRKSKAPASKPSPAAGE